MANQYIQKYNGSKMMAEEDSTVCHAFFSSGLLKSAVSSVILQVVTLVPAQHRHEGKIGSSSVQKEAALVQEWIL